MEANKQNKTIALVHYNTPGLTAAAIASFRKQVPGLGRIVVLDNSDTAPFPPTDGVEVLDNTRGQLIDFAAMIARYPNAVHTSNNHASEKHIASVDYLFDVCPEGFVLTDSDILARCDFSELWQPGCAWCGSVERVPPFPFQYPRLLPFLLWVNVPMLAQYRIRFWHEGKVYKLSHGGRLCRRYYDTGGSLLVDCEGLPHHEVDIWRYIVHFGGASYKPGKVEERAAQWLREHEDCWQP